MTTAALVLLLSTATQAPAAEPAQVMPLHPRVEVGFGLGITDERVGFIPRLRGGALLSLDAVPGLVLGGDVALEGFITGEEGNNFASSSYWEAVLTPRFLAGYDVALEGFSLLPYAYLGVSGGVRVRTVELLGREDTETDIVFGGRVGLGFAFRVQLFYVALELDAGWKDLGPSGTAAVNGGLQF